VEGGSLRAVTRALWIERFCTDLPEPSRQNGEAVQSVRLAAPMNYEVASLKREAANVLRVVTIFRVIVAATLGLRRLLSGQVHPY